MGTPMQRPEPVNISSSDSSSGEDSPRQSKRVRTDAENLEPTIELSPNAADTVQPVIELSPEEALLRKAQSYQEYMNMFPLPTKRGSVIPFRSWVELGMSIKELYKQPLHYLTNIHLRQLDRMRIGAEDEHTPLHFLIHPVKAEASIWLQEEFNRQSASPHHLVKLWVDDPLYHMYIDRIFPKLPGSSE